jgi:hypothetical protein
MKKIRIIAVALLLAACSQVNAQDCFGDCKAVDASKAMSGDKLGQFAEAVFTAKPEVATMDLNDVTISGPVDEVCQAKGCWVTMQLSNGKKMTMKFKDYAFFMPKDCSGKTVTAHGKMFIKTTSVAELKHLAEDAGKSKKEIKKIKSPKQEIRFEADGVLLG